MTWTDILNYMIDGEVILQASAIGLGTGLSALFHHFYSKNESVAKKIENTKLFLINDNLISIVKQSEGQCLPYIAISGKVTAQDEVLKSRYFPDKEGVIGNFVTAERKETWSSFANVWQESDRVVADITESVPFSLTEKDNTAVHVIDPFDSTWCENSMDIVNKEYRTPNSSFMDSILGVVSGDRIKGYTDTEKMLRVGTQLLGIGELFLEDDVLKLRKPTNSEGEFILTRLSHPGIVSEIRVKAKLWRFLYLMFLGATAAGLYFAAKRWWRKYIEAVADMRRQQEIDEIRRQRENTTRASGNASDRSRTNGDNVCVVCLTNPRECVILECGHICACVDCMGALPSPKLCPMCRARVDKIVPLFYA